MNLKASVVLPSTFLFICLAAFKLTPLAAAGQSSTNELPQSTKARLAEDYGKLPMSFEINQGQTDSQVKFLSRGSGYTLFLNRAGEAVLALQKPQEKPAGAGDQPSTRQTAAGAVVRMNLVNANPTPRVEGLNEMAGKSNYFVGTGM